MEHRIREISEAMQVHGYVADRPIATAVHLLRTLGKPLLVEGEAGVGKTEIAKVLAQMLETELIRLQCYEGLDVHTALYEWNYQKQLLRIRMEGLAAERRPDADRRADGPHASDRHAEDRGAADRSAQAALTPAALEHTIFGPDYLLERPLLRAITREEPAVLLIDEIDRADEEFEAFLLELLSDFQVSIPELGTVRATSRPFVVLTSNGTRELSDALRRRCLYLWIDYPSFEKELRILRSRVPEASKEVQEAAVRFVQRLRGERLFKTPGVAETLDWARALEELGAGTLDATLVQSTLGCLVKDRHDFARLDEETVARLLEEARGAPGGER